MPAVKETPAQLPVPGTKRAVAWVKFTKPTEALLGIHVLSLTSGEKIRFADGYKECPPMYRDAGTQELVIGSVRIPLASGLVGPYELADAAKGKTAP